MKKIVAIVMLVVGCSVAANAQSFLDRLQKKVKGQGTVTVHQAAAISELVNGTSPKSKATSQQETPTKFVQQETPSKVVADKEPAKATPDKPKHETTPPSTSTTTTTVAPIEESRKKVPNKSYKATGYRVQVFAGGNTRADRQKAERIGNALKSYFPEVPVYVHFYSPRWICRIGNYRSYEEAHKALQEVKGLGYKQATIVKGKITVML